MNLPRYKTILDTYTPTNDPPRLPVSTSSNPIENCCNVSVPSSNQRKRPRSDEFNVSKRFHSCQSSLGIYILH